MQQQSQHTQQPARPQQPQQPRYALSKPVFFIGFMGAGKTTLGRKLARSCGLASVDLDSYIERCEGMTCKQLIETCGEKRFRAMESDALRQFAYGQPMVISCGGGIITSAESRSIINDAGFSLYLQIEADEAKERISNPSTRPMLGNLENARRTNEERKPMYLECCDATIVVGGKNVWQVVDEAKEALIKAGVLCTLSESK